MQTKILGIINATPDSFSDASGTVSTSALMARANQLIDEGADILDIGGDSTRPGSICVGYEEEWRRIAPLLEMLAHRIPCSVDTHDPIVAQRAIENGAVFINDISGVAKQEMITTVAASSASYIFMFNAHGAAHTFGPGLNPASAVETIKNWILETTSRLIAAGIPANRLIADPGMGAFISSEPTASWEVLNRFGEIAPRTGGVLLGCSRKRFLRGDRQLSLDELDQISCKSGADAIKRLPPETANYLRVHNVAMQRQFLDRKR